MPKGKGYGEARSKFVPKKNTHKEFKKVKTPKGHAFPEEVLKAHKEGKLGKTKFGRRKTTFKIKR